MTRTKRTAELDKHPDPAAAAKLTEKSELAPALTSATPIPQPRYPASIPNQTPFPPVGPADSSKGSTGIDHVPQKSGEGRHSIPLQSGSGSLRPQPEPRGVSASGLRAPEAPVGVLRPDPGTGRRDLSHRGLQRVPIPDPGGDGIARPELLSASGPGIVPCTVPSPLALIHGCPLLVDFDIAWANYQHMVLAQLLSFSH